MTRKDIQFIAICVGASALVVIAAHLLWPPQRLSQEQWGINDPVVETTQSAQYSYVASVNSKVFHQPDCKWAKKINPRNLIGFKIREDAVKSGRRPCKLCGAL